MRVGPNVFDLLDDDEDSDGECDGEVDAGDVDVYFSCFGNDGDNAYSPKAVADELKSKGMICFHNAVKPTLCPSLVKCLENA